MIEVINNVKHLREITGAGFLDCKNALEENKNNIDASIDFLRKKGLSKASKKASREAKEGAIGYYQNDSIFTMIQINTETDFAAKNDIFLDFMDEIGNLSLKLEGDQISVDNFKEMTFNGVSINDMFKNIISKIGENIILSKLLIIKNSNDLMVSKYVHNAYRFNIGKLVVVLTSRVDELNEAAKELGKNISMHVAASKPMAIDIDNLDSELIKKEKEFQIDNIKSSGKPDNIIEKILDGKMKKYYSESTLLNQPYILDPDKTVKQVLADFSKLNNFKILNFDLLILGS